MARIGICEDCKQEKALFTSTLCASCAGKRGRAALTRKGDETPTEIPGEAPETHSKEKPDPEDEVENVTDEDPATPAQDEEPEEDEYPDPDEEQEPGAGSISGIFTEPFGDPAGDSDEDEDGDYDEEEDDDEEGKVPLWAALLLFPIVGMVVLFLYLIRRQDLGA
jgi:hypothetical protein